jgi:hypothetical protein
MLVPIAPHCAKSAAMCASNAVIGCAALIQTCCNVRNAARRETFKDAAPDERAGIAPYRRTLQSREEGGGFENNRQ